MIERSEIQYAVADGHHIAYRVLTADPDGVDVVMVNGGNFPMDSLPGDPLADRMIEGLAGLGRLVMFDRRGIALSDAITDWDRSLVAQWEEDLAAVIDASGVDRPVVFSWLAQNVAGSYAISHPEGVEKLVLWNAGTPVEPDEWDVEAFQGFRRRGLDGPEVNAIMWPERWKDATFRDWLDAAGRAGASPSQAERIVDALFAPSGSDAPVDLSQVAVATLVMARHVEGFPVPAGFWTRPAQLIPGAELVDLGVGGFGPFDIGVDDVLAEITRFITGEVRLPDPERRVVAVLFTDLVDSTRQAASVGDRRWKALIDRHDEICERVTGRHGGELVKSTGDGVLALFSSATAAIRAARDLGRDLAAIDLVARAGIHVGQVDRRGADVSGIALNIAARVMAEAGPGQILVSDVVERITDDISFSCVGERPLKGVEGTWTVFEVC